MPCFCPLECHGCQKPFDTRHKTNVLPKYSPHFLLGEHRFIVLRPLEKHPFAGGWTVRVTRAFSQLASISLPWSSHPVARAHTITWGRLFGRFFSLLIIAAPGASVFGAFWRVLGVHRIGCVTNPARPAEGIAQGCAVCSFWLYLF